MIFTTNLPNLSAFFRKAQPVGFNGPITFAPELGSSDIVSKAYDLAKEYVHSLYEILYVGVTNDSSVLGVADTKFNAEILQKILDGMPETNPDEAKRIELDIEAKIKNNKLISFQINPYNIAQTADRWLQMLKREIETRNSTFEQECDGKNEEVVRQDLAVVVMAAVLSHESEHALGGGNMRGESEAIQAEDATLLPLIKDSSQHPEYNYIGKLMHFIEANK